MQIATATQRLIEILQDDEVMQPLYTAAIHGRIGPRKFIKKFWRLLQSYSDDLKEDATNNLDILAARLVAYRPRNVAEAISEKYQNILPPYLEEHETPDSKSRHDHSTKNDNLDDDDQEEDAHKEGLINDQTFEKLTKKHIQEFLDVAPPLWSFERVSRNLFPL